MNQTDPVTLSPVETTRLSHPGIRHGFFTRPGGVSKGIYAGLNASPGSDDDPEAVTENRRRIAAHLNAPAEYLVTPYQLSLIHI